MRHINTRQIDSHLWTFEVTDGYTTGWSATLGRYKTNRLDIRYGDNTNRDADGYAMLTGKTESELVGEAMTLIYNWEQMGICAVEPLDPRWTVVNKSLIHHISSETVSTTDDPEIPPMKINRKPDFTIVGCDHQNTSMIESSLGVDMEYCHDCGVEFHSRPYTK